MRFVIDIELGNAALPLGEGGGWTEDTLQGLAQVLAKTTNRMMTLGDVSEAVLDSNGNRVGTALFVTDDAPRAAGAD